MLARYWVMHGPFYSGQVNFSLCNIGTYRPSLLFSLAAQVFVHIQKGFFDGKGKNLVSKVIRVQESEGRFWADQG